MQISQTAANAKRKRLADTHKIKFARRHSTRAKASPRQDAGQNKIKTRRGATVKQTALRLNPGFREKASGRYEYVLGPMNIERLGIIRNAFISAFPWAGWLNTALSFRSVG